MTKDLEEAPYYYAKDRTVWKRPVSLKDQDGETISTSMGFPVCTLVDMMTDDAAQMIANALNKQEPPQSG